MSFESRHCVLSAFSQLGRMAVPAGQSEPGAMLSFSGPSWKKAGSSQSTTKLRVQGSALAAEGATNGATPRAQSASHEIRVTPFLHVRGFCRLNGPQNLTEHGQSKEWRLCFSP